MVVPGMVARALFPDTIGCATEEACMNFCQSKVSKYISIKSESRKGILLHTANILMNLVSVPISGCRPLPFHCHPSKLIVVIIAFTLI